MSVDSQENHIQPLNIEINEEFKKTFDFIANHSDHVFITGKAGTGKSTFLQHFRLHTKKNIVVLASTGVAAVNVQGQTIHSFFNFKPDITYDGVPDIKVHSWMAKIYQKLDAIVIDEISMVRADLLDCIDAFLRLYGPNTQAPFGGIQLIMIGDLYQLAPVVRQQERNIFQTVYPSPYFFDAKVFKEVSFELMEFEINYRQKDERFIRLLNDVRSNTVEQEQLDVFNERCQADWKPEENDFYVYLTTTNKLADTINYQHIHDLKQELFTYEGTVSGDFDQNSLPTHQNLEVKVGAQVILLNNDAGDRWANGSVGKVIDIFESGVNSSVIVVELANGTRVEVEPFTWELFHFYYNEKTGRIDAEAVGSFRQFPMKLAWAITIHKSQGKTFDKVIVDIGAGAFCHGQLYVAFSRCTTLTGIILKRPISLRDIQVDPRVAQFLREYQYKIAQKKFSLEEKKRIIAEAIEQEQTLEILYVKDNTQKHRRKIIPKHLRMIEHQGQKMLGVEAFCLERQSHWIFRLNGILEIQIGGESHS